VYSVACYGPKGVDKALSSYSLSTKGDAVKAMKTLRTELPKGSATFVLKFCMSVGAEKISSAIADSVASRCSGSSEVASLKSILQSGMTDSGGGTKKGTTMQFDCAGGGITVSLDGKKLGTAKGGGLSKAFCNVYMDDKAVSPALRQSCLNNLCQP
jgi:Chalcone isomerase-like